MEDMLQSQIRENCKLALPNGLKELMSDISREVLRAQPQNLYRFIADYLSSLLVTRDNLAIAVRLCDSICRCECHPELEEELMAIGFDDEEALIVAQVISEQFQLGSVNEASLLLKISEKIQIDIEAIPYIQDAIRKAFHRHQTKYTKLAEIKQSTIGDSADGASFAAKHTLELYKKSNVNESDKDMANKIKSAYKAYEVKCNTFMNQESTNEDISTVDSLSRNFNTRISTASSVSLAGSFLTLPKHRPYSAQELVIREDQETERSMFDYTKQTDTQSYSSKKIGFHDPSIKEYSIDSSSTDETGSLVEEISLLDESRNLEKEERHVDLDTNEEVQSIKEYEDDLKHEEGIMRLLEETKSDESIVESLEEQKREVFNEFYVDDFESDHDPLRNDFSDSNSQM